MSNKNSAKKAKVDIDLSKHGQTTNKRDRVYKTILVDYSKLVKVRIDEKTEVYVKPDANIEKIKAKYLNRKYYD